MPTMSEQLAAANKDGRKGFYFDQQACIGCRTCQIACKDKNDLDVGMLFRKVFSYETGSFPNARTFHLSIACNHCENPACVAACPTGAMYIDEADGTVQHDDSRCIGCKYCAMACPYGQPVFNEATGTIHKCDGCIELRANGELPACVASCPMRALEFGTAEDLRAGHPEAVNQVSALPEASYTNPGLFIEAREGALEADYKRLLV